MIGIGLQPAGISPAGIGEVDVVLGSVPSDTGSLYLSPLGDYARAADGSFLQIGEAAQRVLLAIGTQLGSSTALPDLGCRNPVKGTERFRAAAEDATRAALRKMTDAGEIKVDAITIRVIDAGRAYRRVDFTDLSTGRSQYVQTRI